MDEIVRRKFGPSEAAAMLPWYGGAYTRGFIALHPFLTIEGVDPAEWCYGTHVLMRADKPNDLDLPEWIKQCSEQDQVGKEVNSTTIADREKRSGRRLSWKEVCKDAGFSNHCELNRALLTHISALRPDYADAVGAGRLRAYCSERQIFLPTEGRFQPIMEHALVEMFECTVSDSVIAGDEFGEEERLVRLSSLKADSAWSASSILSPPTPVLRLFAPDNSMLAWVHWDSFFTVIFMDDRQLARKGHPAGLEGFWCSDETRFGWMQQPCVPLAE